MPYSFEFTVLPLELIGLAVPRGRTSPSRLTTRDWVCPIPFGSSEMNIL